MSRPRRSARCRPRAAPSVRNPGGTGGAQATSGIAIFPVQSGAVPLTVKRAVLTNNARVWAAALVWPPGIAPDQQAGAVSKLNATGIVLR